MGVSVNPPKTPVTAGSNAVAAATVPNVCKMPGPPAPFVPAPLPNIGKSGDSPKDYSKKVTIEGKKVAIKGATFKSTGDMASKGTGGGLLSANTHGPTKFVGPGSMDVKIEGKNVQLLGDPMLNNCGGSGSPPNSATLMGAIQMSGMVTVIDGEECPICGKDHTFSESEPTKISAGALAGNFKAQTAAVPQPIQTMLGVVHCKCGKKYADQSGATMVELCRAASASGMKHLSGVEDSYMNDKAARELAYEATLSRVKEGIKGQLGNSEAFQDAWEEAEKRAEKSSKKRSSPAAYPAGACAAQGALLLLMDDGALPAAMTEQWFSSQGRPTQAPIQFLDRRSDPPQVKVEHFAHGTTVPPCRSCEVIVPLLICDDGKDACNHKT